jgi:cytochrome c556
MNYRIALGLIAATAVVSVAFAQAVTPAKDEAEAKAAAEARHKHFEALRQAYEPLGSMLKPLDRGGTDVDSNLIIATAPKLIELANAIPGKFSVDTRSFQVKTRARDAIWTSAADFKARADALATAIKDAADLSHDGNKGDIKKAVQKIGQSCGACHDSFRAEAG